MSSVMLIIAKGCFSAKIIPSKKTLYKTKSYIIQVGRVKQENIS